LGLGDFVLLWLRCWAGVVAFLVPEAFFACNSAYAEGFLVLARHLVVGLLPLGWMVGLSTWLVGLELMLTKVAMLTKPVRWVVVWLLLALVF
jgi:hypothetical protein